MPLVLLVLLLVAGLAVPAGAAGQVTAERTVDEVASALRSDPVFSDPEAERGLSADEEARLEDRIRSSDAGPVLVAVLPAAARDEAGGSPDRLLLQIAERTGRRGTYVLVAGDTLRAASNVLGRGQAGALARQALDARRSEGTLPVLLELVDRVADARRTGAGRGTPFGGRREPVGDTGSGGLLAFLAILAGGFGLVALVRRRRRRREEAAQLEDLKRAARDDLVVLGDEVRAVDLDVEMPGADPRARETLSRALTAYERAESALDHASHPAEIREVTAEIEDGRSAMVAVRARLAGEEPPERRPPCFFDPRHGPSSRDVEWSPHGGVPRSVPACEADALRVEEGGDPHVREVEVMGRRMPYHEAPGWFASPYAGGFFGSFGGGLLPGLFGGMLLHDLMTPDFGWGDMTPGPGDAGWGDFGGGDFGGGGFGGGDFGGGGDF